MNILIYAIILNFIKCNLSCSITLVEVLIKIMIFKERIYLKKENIYTKRKEKRIYIYTYI